MILGCVSLQVFDRTSPVNAGGIRQELGWREGRILALVLVVAHRRVDLELVGHLEGRIREHRPGVVVLLVGEEGRVRIVAGEPRLAMHGEYAAPVSTMLPVEMNRSVCTK